MEKLRNDYEIWDALETIPAFLNLRYEDRASIVSVAVKVLAPDIEEIKVKQEIIDMGFIDTSVKQEVINIKVIDDGNPIHVYVDGSYNKVNDLTAAGVVILCNGHIYKKGFIVETEEGHSWNIDGEIHAVLEAIRICVGEATIEGVSLILEQKNFIISYDYEGIEKWATREWKAKSKIAKHYVEEFDKLVRDHKINIEFNKVKAHSGNEYNDIADKLAYNLVTTVKKK